MKKVILILLFVLVNNWAFSQIDTASYVAVCRISNRIMVDFGDGKLMKPLKDLVPGAPSKAESDIEIIVQLNRIGFDFVAVLPEQKSYSGNWIPLLFKRK